MSRLELDALRSQGAFSPRSDAIRSADLAGFALDTADSRP
jgi:hypothetical protein